jgi:hypothetical protein
MKLTSEQLVTDLDDLLGIQELSLDSDYMIGLYNGMLLAKILVTGEEYKPLSLKKEY